MDVCLNSACIRDFDHHYPETNDFPRSISNPHFPLFNFLMKKRSKILNGEC